MQGSEMDDEKDAYLVWTWAAVSRLPLHLVTLDKLHNPSEPRFPHPQIGVGYPVLRIQ